MKTRSRWLWILTFCLAPSPAFGQTVEGTVRDQATSRPITGAFVVLLDSAGHRRLGALTDSAGRFVLVPATPGAYAVQAQMIGYADAAAERVALLPGTNVRVAFSLVTQAIPLRAIDVNAPPRCRLRSDTAGVALVIWQQARKALELADWSARESGLVLVARRTEGLQYYPPQVLAVDTVRGVQPFVTLSPDSIRRGGLLYPDGNGYTIYAPGPEYILSDDFLDGHCFAARLRRDAVGLTFAPLQRGPHADVKGTLWLDRRSSALRELEFDYEGINEAGSVAWADGYLRFDRTPAGLWLIRTWEIRLALQALTVADPTIKSPIPLKPSLGSPGRLVKVYRGEVVSRWMAPGPTDGVRARP